MVPMEPLPSPAPSAGDPQPQTLEVSGQDTITSDPCTDVSPPRSDSEDMPICSPAQPQDSGEPASTFSPPQMSLLRPETPAPQSCIEPQVQYQDSHELQTPQTLFTHNQPAPLVHFQVSPTQASCHVSVHSGPSVPQQQTPPTAVMSTGGDESHVQQQMHNSELNVKTLFHFQSGPPHALHLLFRAHSCLGGGQQSLHCPRPAVLSCSCPPDGPDHHHGETPDVQLQLTLKLILYSIL